jgi:hypothetical protein
MPRRHMREWRYSSTILDLGIRWRWLFSFTHLPCYPRSNSSRYPLYRRLGGPPNQSGRYVEEKKIYIPRRQSNPGHPAHNPSLYRLSGNSQYKSAQFPSELSKKSWYVCCTVPHNSIIRLYRLTLRWVNSFIAGYLIPEGSLETSRRLIQILHGGLFCTLHLEDISRIRIFLIPEVKKHQRVTVNAV